MVHRATGPGHRDLRERTPGKSGNSRRRRRSQDEAAARAATRRGRLRRALGGGRRKRTAIVGTRKTGPGGDPLASAGNERVGISAGRKTPERGASPYRDDSPRHGGIGWLS